MYVIKVGECYVKKIINGEIILSKEIMLGFKNKVRAEMIAKLLKAELVEITEEVTND